MDLYSKMQIHWQTFFPDGSRFFDSNIPLKFTAPETVRIRRFLCVKIFFALKKRMPVTRIHLLDQAGQKSNQENTIERGLLWLPASFGVEEI